MDKFGIYQCFIIILWITFSEVNSQVFNCNGPTQIFPVSIDIKIGELIRIPTENVNSINTNTYTETYNQLPTTYMKAEYLTDDKILIISGKDNFGQFEEEQSEDVPIFLRFAIICKIGPVDFILELRFNDANNHDPIFLQEHYEIVLPMPLPKGLDVTMFLLPNGIAARDIDIKNNQIKFTSTMTDPFVISTSTKIGEDKKTFYASVTTTQQILRIDGALEFTITATDSGTIPRSTEAHVKFTTNPEVIFLGPPEFESVVYEGKLSKNLELTLDDVILRSDTYSDEIEFGISKFDSNLFVYAQTDNRLKITLKNPLEEEDVKDKSILNFIVTANLPGSVNGNSVVLISVPELECEVPTTIEPPSTSIPTECPVCTTTEPSITTECPTEATSVTTECPTGSTPCPDCPTECTTSSTTDCPVECTTPSIPNCPTTTTNDPPSGSTACPDCPIECTTDCPPTVTTSCPPVITNEPPTTCQDCTEVCTSLPPVSTDCPTLSTTVAPIPDTTPKFEVNRYDITIAPNFVGKIDRVKAIVPSDPSIEVTYLINLENENLYSLRIDSLTGDLSVQNMVSPGIYNFKVLAHNPKHNSIGEASVKLTVTIVNECTDGPRVASSLLIKELYEDQEHLDILYAISGECIYDITYVEPDNLTDIFEIDINTKMLKSKKFYRESQIFSKMILPQIQLTLKLNCNNKNLNSRNYNKNFNSMNTTKLSMFNDQQSTFTSAIKRDDELRKCVLTENIPNLLDTTMLNIIIKDINNNDPEFIYPLTNTIFGYPEPQISEKILPSSLLTLYAIDIDEGINAQIQYKLDSNNHFDVNPENGLIYPLRNAMANEDSILLKAHAQDENGVGRSVSIEFQVKKLKSEHITVVTIINENVVNLEKILEDINKQAKINLQVLSAAVVSMSDGNTVIEKTNINLRYNHHKFVNFADGNLIKRQFNIKQMKSIKKDEDTKGTILRMVVYAFNDQSIPMNTNEVKEKIKAVDNTYEISTLKLDEVIGSQNKENEDDGDDDDGDIAFIVSISILTVLLIIVSVVAFLGWWFWIRPYQFKSVEDRNISTSSETNLANDFETKLGISTAPLNDDQNKSIPYNDSFVRSLTDILEEERLNSIQNSVQNANDIISFETESPPKDRKKSIVTFNELVERIDIPVEMENKDEKNTELTSC